jgi:ketosteroid isomerase-like protein
LNPKEFAGSWERGWNSHDLEIIMSHYRDDIVFRSRKAVPLVGHGEIVGKAALRTYWEAALARQPDLKFRVRDVLVGHQMLVIIYLNHRDVLAAETLYFDDDGKVYRAAACHAPE